jgi:hypothetical protein
MICAGNQTEQGKSIITAQTYGQSPLCTQISQRIREKHRGPKSSNENRVDFHKHRQSPSSLIDVSTYVVSETHGVSRQRDTGFHRWLTRQGKRDRHRKPMVSEKAWIAAEEFAS